MENIKRGEGANDSAFQPPTDEMSFYFPSFHSLQKNKLLGAASSLQITAN
jgi:hypothetical protein